MENSTAPAFNPKHLQELMPSSRKKTDIQLLKRHKNKCMSIMEEAAKTDRYECCYTLQPFEIGSALQYNLDHTAERLRKWLRRKGFGAELDDDNDLCINISWRKEQDQSDEEEEYTERKQRHHHGKRLMKTREIPTIGAAIPLLPHQQPIIPIAKQPYVAPMNHPWFGWMKQEPIREPNREPNDGGEKRPALPRNTTPMKKLFQKKN